MTARETVNAEAGDVTLKEFLLTVINEREDKYIEQHKYVLNQLDKFDSRHMLLLTRLEGFSLKNEVVAAMASSEKAVSKAEMATEKRFDSVNEFRAQMADMQTTLVRKSEVDLRFESLEKKVDAAVAMLQLNQGRSTGLSSAGGVLVIIISFLIGIASLMVSIFHR